ncbi:hypothetical protein GIB67_001188 [Kingdonia uniflora]|uniref:GATA-type domain-containing protein n=1 Tax=Kingdonia uniflora TaxID=39325 RepID=A0A7J7LG60_9MAGN|nr:hypothetical protein GIB67_001188 [Kingdonia uniflora]
MEMFSPPDLFHVDDLLDLSNEDLFYSSEIPNNNFLPIQTTTNNAPIQNTSTFSDQLCVPTDDVAELEWLSNFVHDSFTDFPTTNLNAPLGKAPSKRTRTSPESDTPMILRRCTHCASEKTPQWRTGPRGPKTLCNACGVRYKSGRLVPEYRPAASPSFVLTQHSNSRRKVLELRRQKEESMNLMINANNRHHLFHRHRHRHHSQVC